MIKEGDLVRTVGSFFTWDGKPAHGRTWIVVGVHPRMDGEQRGYAILNTETGRRHYAYESNLELLWTDGGDNSR